MKLSNQTTAGNETVVIGSEKELSFSIDTNSSVIFDILRDKMYSNKIGSIVREVASNSRDANREAGNSDKDISIIISDSYSELLPEQTCIIFKDQGIGISEERMENVFIKYASSTKRYTNAQTGGFGLGAKTPFAYADSFYIHTVAKAKDDEGLDCKKSYLYNALTDDTGRGKMILLEEEITDDPTGSAIIIPIKEGDRDKFIKEIEYYTLLWKNVKYIGIEGHIGEVNKVKETETYLITKNDWRTVYQTGIYGLVDGIPYPLSSQQEGLEFLHKVYINLKDQTIFLKFNTGEVSVSATREQIEYSEKTVEAIRRNFNRSMKSLTEGYQEEVQKLSYIDLIKHVNGTYGQQSIFSDDDPLKHSPFKNLISTLKESDLYTPLKQTQYAGQSLKDILKKHKEENYSYKKVGFEAFMIYKFDAAKYDTVGKKTNMLQYRDIPVVLMDARKDRRRNLTLLEKYDKFLLLKGKDTDGNLTQEQSEFLLKTVNLLDCEFLLYSEVEKKDEPSINSYVMQPTVTVPIREIKSNDWSEFYRTGVPASIFVDRKTGDFKYDLSKTFILLTDQLSTFFEASSFRNRLPVGYKLIVMTEKSCQRYFQEKINPYSIYKADKYGREDREVSNLWKLWERFDLDRKEKELGGDKKMIELAAEVMDGVRKNDPTDNFYFNNGIYATTFELINYAYIDRQIGVWFKSQTGVSVTLELVEFMGTNQSSLQRSISKFRKKSSNSGLKNSKIALLSTYLCKLKESDPLYFYNLTNQVMQKDIVLKGETDKTEQFFSKIRSLRG